MAHLMAEEKKTERVTMLWAPSLKERVRERVGSRGLTGFVLEAVEAKLGTHDAHKAESKELNETRDLVQRMADMFARQSDYEDPVEQLVELGLPSWVDTTGWPVELAKVVPVEDSTPELPAPVVPPVEPAVVEEDEEDLHRPMALSKPKEKPKPVVQDLPHDRQGGDLFARVRAKAAQAGIDLGEANLRPASELARPAEPAAEVQPEPEPVAPPEPAPPAEAAPTCPGCGSPLLHGDCWDCF